MFGWDEVTPNLCCSVAVARGGAAASSETAAVMSGWGRRGEGVSAVQCGTVGQPPACILPCTTAGPTAQSLLLGGR